MPKRKPDPKPLPTTNKVWNERVAWVREQIRFYCDDHIPRLTDPEAIARARFVIAHERAILWASDVVDAAIRLVARYDLPADKQDNLAPAIEALAAALAKRQRRPKYPVSPNR